MKSDEQFIADLNESERVVARFAGLMRGKGVPVWLPPVFIRPDASQRMQYADRGDLMVQMRVEHKRRKINFTGREDYPYATVFIDEKYKVDAKDDGTLLAYVIENAAGTHAAVVYGFTRPHWVVEKVEDKAQGRVTENFAVDKNRVRFCAINEVL